eukprot:scaffold3598_cov115-Cylindrotheca_fusiformis.AAC.3
MRTILNINDNTPDRYGAPLNRTPAEQEMAMSNDGLFNSYICRYASNLLLSTTPENCFPAQHFMLADCPMHSEQ